MKRKSKYRKHVEAAVLDDFPEPTEEEEVVVVVASRGGNILEVKPIPICRKSEEIDNEKQELMLSSNESNNEDESLCLLPAKFRKLVWVRRGTVLIVSKAAEDYVTSRKKKGKVRYTVNHILFQPQVKHLIKQGIIMQANLDNLMNSPSNKVDENSKSINKSIDKPVETLNNNLENLALNSSNVNQNHDGEKNKEINDDDNYTSEEDNMSDVFVNNNRAGYMVSDSSDLDDSDDE